MSDLAPFVAAVIESRVVTELQEENQRLRAEIAQTRAAALQSARFGGCIQITGEGGSPVYATGKVHDAERERSVDNDYYGLFVDLSNDAHQMCPISRVMATEIRVNGVKLATVGESERETCDSDFGDVYAEFRYCFLEGLGTPWDAFAVVIKFGPLAPLGDRAPEPHQLKDEEVEEVEFDRFFIMPSETSVRSGDVIHDIVTRRND